MSKPEIERLTRAVEAEANELDTLHRTMRDRRMAFVAVAPSDLESAVDGLGVAAEKVRLLGEHRGNATRDVATELNLPEDAALVDVLARLATPARSRIDAALSRARHAARAIGVEQRVGSRLLDFSRRTQEAMFVDLLGLAERDGANTYDRRARSVKHQATGGSLIRGTL